MENSAQSANFIKNEKLVMNNSIGGVWVRKSRSVILQFDIFANFLQEHGMENDEKSIGLIKI